jgi:chromosome segregation protein
MDRAAADELLALAASLEQRDAAVAHELETVRRLAERAEEVRGQAADTSAGLERVPRELEELAERRADADTAAESARSGVADAESRLAEVESARRRREDAIDRARSELQTAREALDDAVAQLDRLSEREKELVAEQGSLEATRGRLIADAAAVAAELGTLERVAEPARRNPGTTLADLEEWGGQARAALFVARGTLETERERIVAEANALGAAVLGEELGGSSVALVRRRVEERLG